MSTRSRAQIHIVRVTRDSTCALMRCLVHKSACRHCVGDRDGKMGERKGQGKVREDSATRGCELTVYMNKD